MYKIEQVLRHRKPMLLVDELISFDEKSAKVRVTINDKSEFFSPQLDGIPSYIGIEYMAQCIAAYAGAIDLSCGRNPQLGFLLGTRKYKPEVNLFHSAQSMLVEATEIMRDGSGLSVFECTIIDASSKDLLATAKINVFQPKDVDSYFQEQ